MDALIRSIDTARLERDSRGEYEQGSPTADLGGAEGPAVSDRAPFPQTSVALSEATRERERLLPAGAPGPIGAAYKMLRTQVLRRLSSINANSLAVLSASNGEGKTLTAINLAVAVAADPAHTALLVDLDLRNPSIHRRLGMRPTVGIEDCLSKRRGVQEALVRIQGYDRLTVLPARGRVEQSSDLLLSARMVELMLELRSRYSNRILIFDLPPVLLADDALAFSRLVQAGLFVVAESKTEREQLARGLMLLDKLPIIGTVLNLSKESIGSYY